MLPLQSQALDMQRISASTSPLQALAIDYRKGPSILLGSSSRGAGSDHKLTRLQGRGAKRGIRDICAASATLARSRGGAD